MSKDFLKSQRLVLGVDFDGVIHDKNGIVDHIEETWKLFGKPLPGAKETLDRVRQSGTAIIVHTCRATDRIIGGDVEYNQLNALRQWLALYSIPYDLIWTDKGKPLCHAYLDDRGIRFLDWTSAASILKEMGFIKERTMTK